MSQPHGAWRCVLTIEDPEALRELVGELGTNLKRMGRALGVEVHQRGQELIVVGGGPDGQDPARGPVDVAAEVICQLVDLVGTGFPLRPADVDQACRLIRSEPQVRLTELFGDTVYVGVGKRRVHPRSLRQRQYIHQIRTRELVFGIGPAGTGKTYLAMAMAVGALFRNDVRRIILCRPAVEAGEKLGFLPGDLADKVNPYLRPLYDALHDLVEVERVGRLIEKQVIEVAPLAFMRGRTLSNAFVILDEAQNTTTSQMKMLLTRIGMDSRVVVTGDITQVDLPRGQRSGLRHTLHVLRDIEEIGITEFTHTDVVRHPLVSRIVQAYDRAEADEAIQRQARQAERIAARAGAAPPAGSGDDRA